MLSARGRLLLFADADGATKFSDISKLEEEMKRINTQEVRCPKMYLSLYFFSPKLFVTLIMSIPCSTEWPSCVGPELI